MSHRENRTPDPRIARCRVLYPSSYQFCAGNHELAIVSECTTLSYFNPMNVKSLEKIDFTWISIMRMKLQTLSKRVQQREIPIFAFETTSHDSSG